MKVVKPKQVTVAYKPSGFRNSPATYYNSSGYLATAANNEIRFGYHPKTLQYLGAIVEDQSTNMHWYSESFDNSSWDKSGISAVNANSVVSPTNATNADVIIANTALSYHAVSQQITPSATAGQTYTVSVYVKANGYNWFQIRLGGTASPGTAYAFFNLSNGRIGTTSGLLSADIESLQNNWHRVSITRTLAASGNLFSEFHIRSADNQGDWSGNGSSGIALFGAQAELKQKMTSYISTTSATVTRQADTNNISSLVYTSTLNTEPEWNSAGVTYVFGQYVSVNTYYNDSIAKSISDEQSGKYLCLTTHVSNGTNGPLQSTTNWARVGPTNQFAMFDTKVSTQTKQYTGYPDGTPLVVTCCLTSELDTISLINISGAYVDVAISDGTYSQEYFYNVMVANRYDTYDNDTETQTDSITVTNIPKKTTVFITIKVSPVGIYTPAAVGIVVQGEAKFLGGSQYGVTAGIVDYSRKETDEFGNTSLVVRNFAKKLNAKLFIDKPQINDVQQYLYSLRATPALWVASDDSEYSVPLNIYGFYKDFSTEISYVTAAVCNLDIEGLT